MQMNHLLNNNTGYIISPSFTATTASLVTMVIYSIILFEWKSETTTLNENKKIYSEKN